MIAKRPVANVAWKSGAQQPQNRYHLPYWERLRELDYDFTHRPLPEAVELALRFTVFQPGVSTAIVGTSSPGRWAQNAAAVARGALTAEVTAGLRARWSERAEPGWTGQQ